MDMDMGMDIPESHKDTKKGKKCSLYGAIDALSCVWNCIVSNQINEMFPQYQCTKSVCQATGGKTSTGICLYCS